LVSGHPSIVGLIEERGTGIISQNIALSGVLRLCVDLAEEVARLPEAGQTQVEIEGVSLPRLTIRADVPPHEAARRVLAAMNWT
jgi:hypothetical protein